MYGGTYGLLSGILTRFNLPSTVIHITGKFIEELKAVGTYPLPHSTTTPTPSSLTQHITTQITPLQGSYLSNVLQIRITCW